MKVAREIRIGSILGKGIEHVVLLEKPIGFVARGEPSRRSSYRFCNILSVFGHAYCDLRSPLLEKVQPKSAAVSKTFQFGCRFTNGSVAKLPSAINSCNSLVIKRVLGLVEHSGLLPTGAEDLMVSRETNEE